MPQLPEDLLDLLFLDQADSFRLRFFRDQADFFRLCFVELLHECPLWRRRVLGQDHPQRLRILHSITKSSRHTISHQGELDVVGTSDLRNGHPQGTGLRVRIHLSIRSRVRDGHRPAAALGPLAGLALPCTGFDVHEITVLVGRPLPLRPERVSFVEIRPVVKLKCRRGEDGVPVAAFHFGRLDRSRQNLEFPVSVTDCDGLRPPRPACDFSHLLRGQDLHPYRSLTARPLPAGHLGSVHGDLVRTRLAFHKADVDLTFGRVRAPLDMLDSGRLALPGIRVAFDAFSLAFAALVLDLATKGLPLFIDDDRIRKLCWDHAIRGREPSDGRLCSDLGVGLGISRFDRKSELGFGRIMRVLQEHSLLRRRSPPWARGGVAVVHGRHVMLWVGSRRGRREGWLSMCLTQGELADMVQQGWWRLAIEVHRTLTRITESPFLKLGEYARGVLRRDGGKLNKGEREISFCLNLRSSGHGGADRADLDIVVDL
ncbi:uncharacterized protein MKK02DRAFT_29855 [Dioszegia hungarica]|uniref:Uncharacterized protein n=1 Tax=Dioszegia hungarica TaxID=4972 RepID=A0AA38HG03_9TREE|nr:uncharacterized protein MKK02DRAFT_29855 [Dioszegia hungarica]KAI9639890.1 hypothetical protein MKK02DRAFT_29855 [Dioszegia hungarica]